MINEEILNNEFLFIEKKINKSDGNIMDKY
jgi:hypothetical protein